MNSPIEIRIVTGQTGGVADHIPDIARLRIEVFRAFPYLYDGSLDYEERYLATYLKCPQSVLVLALNQGQVVGASTGLPLAAETAEIQQPFLTHGYPPETIFYCGESVLLPTFRGRGIYRRFFYEREAHARTLHMTHIFFCGVVRPADHPRLPSGYLPLDDIWRHFGYVPYPELIAQMAWKDLDEPQETFKPMAFWGKSL